MTTSGNRTIQNFPIVDSEPPCSAAIGDEIIHYGEVPDDVSFLGKIGSDSVKVKHYNFQRHGAFSTEGSFGSSQEEIALQ